MACPSVVTAGSSVTATWSNIAAPGPTDWVGLYDSSSAPEPALVSWAYTNGTAGGILDSLGHYVAVRTDATHQRGYKNNVLVVSDAADASAAPTNLNFYALGINNVGAPIGWGGQQAFLTIGGALNASQVASVTTRFRTALTALGVP